MPRERSHTNQRADTEQTRKAILRAAHTLFMEFGYRAVTTRMVAEACGVKQPLLYYHFADKETLYLEVHREQMAISHAALVRIAGRHQERVPERLKAVISYLRLSSRQNMSVFFHELKHEMSPSLRSTLRVLFRDGIVAPIMSIFEDGIQSGFLLAPSAGGVSPRLATYLLLSALSSPSGSVAEDDSRDRFFEEREARKTDFADEIVHALIYGMIARTE